jgi:hypothetical protein
VLLYILTKAGQAMSDDNDENKVPLSENTSNEKDIPEASKDNTGMLHVKERRIVLRFCMLLVIIGVLIALITGKQWWLASPLELFAIIVTAIYVKNGGKK